MAKINSRTERNGPATIRMADAGIDNRANDQEISSFIILIKKLSTTLFIKILSQIRYKNDLQTSTVLFAFILSG